MEAYGHPLRQTCNPAAYATGGSALRGLLNSHNRASVSPNPPAKAMPRRVVKRFISIPPKQQRIEAIGSITLALTDRRSGRRVRMSENILYPIFAFVAMVFWSGWGLQQKGATQRWGRGIILNKRLIPNLFVFESESIQL